MNYLHGNMYEPVRATLACNLRCNMIANVLIFMPVYYNHIKNRRGQTFNHIHKRTESRIFRIVFRVFLFILLKIFKISKIMYHMYHSVKDSNYTLIAYQYLRNSLYI